MFWIELSLNTTAEAIDWVRTLLAIAHYSGTLQVQPYVATTAADEEGAWAFTVRWYVPNQAGVRSQISRMDEQLAALQRTGMTSALETVLVEQVPASPAPAITRVGRRFLLLPAALAEPTTSDEIALRLAPSLAFGSGFHPATVLMLQLLEQFVQPKMVGLDLGCGSGILSVAMAKLGARVLALDNDPVAVQATQAMVQLNQVEARVTVAAGSLGRGNQLGHWLGGEAGSALPAQSDIEAAGESGADLPVLDLIAANILARVHLTLVQDYAAALQAGRHPAGGLLLTAGFTEDYADQVCQALTGAGFEAIARQQQGEWVALASRLPRSFLPLPL